MQPVFSPCTAEFQDFCTMVDFFPQLNFKLTDDRKDEGVGEVPIQRELDEVATNSERPHCLDEAGEDVKSG